MEMKGETLTKTCKKAFYILNLEPFTEVQGLDCSVYFILY